jgi:multidrug resistance protein MdtO
MWRDLPRQVALDLAPAPGRLAMTWRVALLCALVAAAAMIYKVPEAAISCYLVIFIARPDGAECVAQALGLIVLVFLVVAAMVPVIQLTADAPLARILVIAAASCAFVWLGAVSRLGEIGSIIGLVVAYILTLVDQVPAGEIATRGLLYAAEMAILPMVLMIAFNLVLGRSPHRLLRATVVQRLAAAAEFLDAPDAARRMSVDGELAQGMAGSDLQVRLARAFHTAPDAAVAWLAGAAASSYRLLLALGSLDRATPEPARRAFAQSCRRAADAVAAGQRPEAAPGVAPTGNAMLDAAHAALAGLSLPDGGTSVTAAKQRFFVDDAFTRPGYQQYALKTTAAAVTCYLAYSLIGWQGIHTAMITCYVAALGTTGETVHKLALRIGGCLVGALMGFLAIAFVIPHLDSVGGLAVLVFAGLLPAAWVAAGSQRISYAGVQIGLAFLLTILTGFGPSVDMDAGRDRIVGILLGNTVVYLVFTGIWPRSAALDARERLADALRRLAALAAQEPDVRVIGDAAQVEAAATQAAEQIRLLPYEPRSQRPTPSGITRLQDLVAEIRALVPVVLFARERSDAVAATLRSLADRIDERAQHAAGTEARDATGDGTDLEARVLRIERLTAA